MLAGLSIEQIILVVGIILVSMAAHEAMHAFTSHALGDPTAKDEGRLTLNPFQHIDIFMTVLLPVALLLLGLPPIFIAKPVPFNPEMVKYGDYGAALVALAGPFTNLALAVLAALILQLGGGGLALGLQDGIELFMYINVVFFVFNMIPFPPLDGSRLLYAFAPEPLRRIMFQIESAGLIVLVVFVLLLLPVIGPIVTSITEHILNFLLR